MSFGNGHLPDEIWLQILSHLPASSAWLRLRRTSRQLRACTEDHFLTTLLPHFTVSLTYSLGSGTTHRWFDIRATVTLAYASLNRFNPQYALFELGLVHPERTADRAREKWKRMCADGLGRELDWRVRFAIDDGDAGSAQTWRVKFGIDEPSDFGRRIKLRRLVVGEGENVWVDWKEMLGGYFQKAEEEASVNDIIRER